MSAPAQPLTLDNAPEVMRPREVAELLGVHYQTVLARVADKTLRSVTRGKRIYIRRKWVAEFLGVDEQAERVPA